MRVVAKILYNFYLTNHVTNLNLNCDTCLDIGTNAMVESEEEIYSNKLQRLEKMNVKAQLMFHKATKSK